MLQIKKAYLALAIACLCNMPINAIQSSTVARGPLFGAFCYWFVKGLGYGVPVVVGGAAIGSAAGAAGLAAGNTASIVTGAAQTAGTNALMNALPGAVGSLTTFTNIPVVGFATSGLTAAELAAYNAAMVTNLGIISGNIVPIVANTAVAEIAGASVMLPYAAAPVNCAMGGVAAGKAIVATIGVEAAGALTAGIVTAANGAAGYITLVEGTAASAAIIGTAVPFLP